MDSYTHGEDSLSNLEPLTPEEYEAVSKILNILSGGIVDPEIQALLVYRHLIHTGWATPDEASRLRTYSEDAKEDLRLLRQELEEGDSNDDTTVPGY